MPACRRANDANGAHRSTRYSAEQRTQLPRSVRSPCEYARSRKDFDAPRYTRCSCACRDNRRRGSPAQLSVVAPSASRQDCVRSSSQTDGGGPRMAQARIPRDARHRGTCRAFNAIHDELDPQKLGVRENWLRARVVVGNPASYPSRRLLDLQVLSHRRRPHDSPARATRNGTPFAERLTGGLK